MADSTMSQGLSIAGLTQGLKGIQDNADLKLSEEVAKQYRDSLKRYRDTLDEVLTKDMAGLELDDSNAAGALRSAKKTITNLNEDVTDIAGIRSVLRKYIDYLDQLDKTVAASCAQLINTG